MIKSLAPVIVAKIRFLRPVTSVAELKWIRSQFNDHFGPVLLWNDLLSRDSYKHLSGRTVCVLKVPLEGNETEAVQNARRDSLAAQLQRVVGIVRSPDYELASKGEWEASERDINLKEAEGDPVEVILPNASNPFYSVAELGDQIKVGVSSRVGTPLTIKTSDLE